MRSLGLGLLIAVAVCVMLTPLAGCGDARGEAAASTSPPVATSASPPSLNVAPAPLVEASVPVLSAGLKTAFASGRGGEPLRAAPTTVIAALERYFATADPAEFNHASRLAFVWAFTMAREPDGDRSTDTRQYVSVYFYADGEAMVAAGSIAPGFNSHLMRLSRPSPSEPWHSDGLYYP